MLWSRSSNCQGRDDMTESVVEPSSRISLPTMTDELRASHKRGRPSRYSFASCKCSRPSHLVLDPTAGHGRGPHSRCVVHQERASTPASAQTYCLVADAGARKQHRHVRLVEAKPSRSFTLPAVVLSGLVAGLFAWRRRRRHRCVSAHNEVLSEDKHT